MVKENILYKSLLLIILFANISPVLSQVKVHNLRCEMLVNPLGVDVASPRLSWEIESAERNVQQTTYQVMVASTKEKLARGEADYWNSGKVNADQSIHIEYAGKKLNSRAACYWKVIITTNKGTANSLETAFWTTGLLEKNDWKAKWIGYDHGAAWDSISQFSRLSARYFRKRFQSALGIKRASVYIAGLGLYELYINGKKANQNAVLVPSPTDYRKSVLYNTIDVTSQVKAGENVIGAVLGNGRFFTMRQNYKPKKINTFGYPKMLLQLEIEYTNGSTKTIVSNASWKFTADGPIRTNNEYDGEEYDATKELAGWNSTGFDDGKWSRPELVKAPGGILVAQKNEPMKVMKIIKPVLIKRLRDEKYILDMGQNFSGCLHMKVSGKRGQRVTFRFGESLQPTGQLYVANLRDAKVTDVYTLRGGAAESWQPSFVYHGFRYVEISNYPGIPSIENFEGQMVYDDLQTTGSFVTSSETINRIYQNAWWGIASNYKGMPIDCPQRNERQPWLGDRATGSTGESFLFDNEKLYAKWLDDIEQSQTTEGAIPDVAPAFWNYYSDNVTWPGTYILVANMLYRQFGDKQSITKHYPSMKKWMDYMRDKYLVNDILTKDKYGDWCVPPESLEMIRSKDSLRNTNGALMATAYYYRLLQHMKDFAVLAGKEADAENYSALAEKIKPAFNKKFFNSQKNYYDNNTVTANILPLYFGMVPEVVEEKVFNNIYNKIKIENHMHISTGVIGTQWLMRGLTDHGRSDIAYTMASTTSYPSWGYMVENGATTIWELWNGNTANPQMNSQNHVMLLGDLLIWYYENLAGIKSDDKSVAFKKIIMKPEIVDGLYFVNASYKSTYGNIKSHWVKDSARKNFNWQITIPANTKAIIYIPASSLDDITENAQSVKGANGITFLKMEDGNAVFEIGSGSYFFESATPFKKGIVKDEFIFKEAAFPESHAATIAETPGGLIAAWFGGTKEGNKDVCIWTSHLINEQWSAPVKVADGIVNDTLRYACYNPVLIQVPNGELLLFYKIGPNVAGWTGWMMRSADGGKTWSQREALPAGFLGPIKNKPVMIDGKLICPSSTEKDGWRVHFEITPDLGKTWSKSDPINDGKIISAIQPSILTYADGRMQVVCRSKNRTINESWSTDGGKTWSPMKASQLPNNNSGTDAVTLADGRQLLVYNHVKPAPELPNGKGARTPLNVAVSKDGINWEAALVLEDSPISQYSYPSVIQSKDGMVHIVYTWRRERIKYVKIDPAKLELKPILNEKWPGVVNVVNKPSED
ncbi:MAG: alpha-L-rhamnosidase [Ferruginibacter sp.]|nr:alpha-L-rhamnosidase [Ferruginibacter sp.]